jgi:hypothetical protein
MKNKKIYSFRRRQTSLWPVQLTVYSIMLLIFNCLLCTLCYAETVSSSELINNAKRYDGKTVIYTGEVIGEIMERDRGVYAWANVHDGVNAIGIFLGKDQYGGMTSGNKGGYKYRGDIFEIEGVFHRSCIEHGGDLDIHAVSLRKVRDGGIIPEKINAGKINLAILLAGGLCLVLILNRLRHK